MRTRPVPSLALLAAATAIGFSALHIVVPALPLLARVFDARPADVQLVVTLYLAGIGVGQLVYGPVSDRFGRRPVLLVGLVMFLAGTLLCGLAWSLPVLIAGRVLEACGACAGTVLGRAIIRDVYDRESAARGLALVMMAMTLAPAISPAFGAYLAEWVDWRAIFALLGLLGALVLALIWLRLGETNRNPTRLDLVGMGRSYASLLGSRPYLAFALCSACSSGSWFTFTSSAPYLLSEQMHRPPSTYGLMILLPMATYVLGNAVAARFAIRLGSNLLFAIGLWISLASGVLMVVWCLVDPTPWALFMPMAISGIGNGISQPSAVASALSVQPRIAGAASGLTGFLQMAVSSVGTYVVGMLPHDDAMPIVLVIGAFLALAVLFAIPVMRMPRDSRPAGARPLVAAKSSGAD
ncbi:MAG TPA: multidrug effflux MFS transporter [Stellaceae bacterium]|jgi:DHA1 family bicyclomycin/chloramphenicol resistance-like MFS transporter|nr:multidrug effflux MFS transporter [Stellaceae bacterium]